MKNQNIVTNVNDLKNCSMTTTIPEPKDFNFSYYQSFVIRNTEAANVSTNFDYLGFLPGRV